MLKNLKAFVKVCFATCAIVFAANFNILYAQASVSVPAGTRVPILVPNTISSNSIKTSDNINVLISEDVAVNSKTVFRKGDTATLSVFKAQSSGRFGRPGRVEISGGFITDIHGDKHPINISYLSKGKSRRAFSIAGTIISIPLIMFFIGLVTLPVAVMTSGKEARVGEGLILEGLTTTSVDIE
jgi:hypothetical protein